MIAYLFSSESVRLVECSPRIYFSVRLLQRHCESGFSLLVLVMLSHIRDLNSIRDPRSQSYTDIANFPRVSVRVFPPHRKSLLIYRSPFDLYFYGSTRRYQKAAPARLPPSFNTHFTRSLKVSSANYSEFNFESLDVISDLLSDLPNSTRKTVRVSQNIYLCQST